MYTNWVYLAFSKVYPALCVWCVRVTGGTGGNGVGTAWRHVLGPPVGERKGERWDGSRTGLAGTAVEQAQGAGLAKVELAGSASTR